MTKKTNYLLFFVFVLITGITNLYSMEEEKEDNKINETVSMLAKIIIDPKNSINENLPKKEKRRLMSRFLVDCPKHECTFITSGNQRNPLKRELWNHIIKKHPYSFHKDFYSIETIFMAQLRENTDFED